MKLVARMGFCLIVICSACCKSPPQDFPVPEWHSRSMTETEREIYCVVVQSEMSNNESVGPLVVMRYFASALGPNPVHVLSYESRLKHDIGEQATYAFDAAIADDKSSVVLAQISTSTEQVTNAELLEICPKGTEFTERFYSRFPYCNGLWVLSPIVLTPAKDRAIVYIEYHNGTMGGFGEIVTLANIGGSWSETKRYGYWEA